MASRQGQFLKREPWGAPKVPPASRPPNPARRPPTRDPRVIPWRPKPKPIPKPAPGGPLFPGVPKPKHPPFGKRPPHLPLPGGWLGRLKPLRPFLRLHPFLTLPFLAWDLYDLYQAYRQDASVRGYYKVGPECTGADWINFDRFSIYTRPCGSRQSPAPAEYSFTAPYPSTIFEWWRGIFTTGGGRKVDSFGFRQRWDRDPAVPNPAYIPPQEGWVVPPSPLELPYPYPFAAPPVPVTPPLTRPNQEPGYQPRPQPKPSPAPRPLAPPGAVAPVPAIEWTPGEPATSGFHERRPPIRDKEKEKKKRLKPGTAAAWLNFMSGAIGSYTEVDDTVAALYKGLPWKLRRWRGRDGVWRDRDITSVDRAKRLYQLLGQLDVQKGIEEIIKQQLSDAAFGMVGNKLKQKAKELGDEGLWTGNTGFQTGSANRFDTWEEAYEQLRKEQAGKVKYRQYTVHEQQADGSWKWVKKVRPVTQVPWFMQKSRYLRMARRGTAEWWQLTAAEKRARKKTVQGYYYAPSPSDRPLYFNRELSSGKKG